MNSKFYFKKRVCVTGGAGFISYHLIRELITLGAKTTVIDNLSQGSISNILRVWKEHKLSYKKTSWGYEAQEGHKFVNIELMDYHQTLKALNGQEIVFHLAATFGGRGFITTRPADCCDNFSINTNVFKASRAANVERVHFASSACVYPHDLQNTFGSSYLLKETDAPINSWTNADCEYGWSKLMGETTLKAFNKQYHMQSSIARYVTAYGPWQRDTHGIIALIKRAIERQDPYVIWGSGKQDRDFTYVRDIVSGSLSICAQITNADSFNIGTSHRYTIREVANMIFDIIGWEPKRIIFDKSMPEGVKSRALDIKKARKVLNWKPKTGFREGLEKTIAWYTTQKEI